MRKAAFDQLMAGMEDALAYAQGDKTRGVEHKVPAIPDVATIRRNLNLSQSQFATTFGLDKSSIQEWEQGRRRPDRAARVLLRVIELNPAIVQEAVRTV